MSEAGLTWGRQFGLATTPLFEPSDSPPPGNHHVLLDGGLGTFALSDCTEELWRTSEPAAWAWSSDVPHHVTVTSGKVAVVRWDKPNDARVFDRTSVERSLERFYSYINDDRLRSNRRVVDHLLGFFRRVRSLAHAASLPDARSTDLFATALADLISPEQAKADPAIFGLPPDAPDLRGSVDSSALRAAVEEMQRASGSLSLLKFHPALAVRHAGGQIFQEAHFELLKASPALDLFGLIDTPEVTPVGRSGTHFTPAPLARIIVEQALSNISNLQGRDEIVIADPACGSGAFLHEALRALRRTGFSGRVKLIGRDISPAAISMARFVVCMSLRDWKPKGGAVLELTVGDALGEAGIPPADLIVMNPPFIAFGAQTEHQRQQVQAATGPGSARGDYSMAFVVRALEALNEEGALGALFPASLLSLKAAASWRERLIDLGTFRFLGSLGDFGLFTHAQVQVACAVIQKGRSSTSTDLTALVTENDTSATGAAFRELRKLNGSAPMRPISEKSWHIFPLKGGALRARPTWRLPTPKAERVLQALADTGLPTIGQLFSVAQGIQTGLNEVLLLSSEEWRQLPTKERKFFRPATMSDSIQNGQITRPYYVFFPHKSNGPLFPDEAAVKRSLPVYFKTYLLPNKDRLAGRASIVRAKRLDWWGLMHPREWAFSKTPRLLSKFFAAEGGFVGDYEAKYVAVMGHVWTPSVMLLDDSKDALPIEDILAAYVALFNSPAFIKLVSLFAPHVAGGQYDISARHVAPIPVPNMRELSVDPVRGRIVSRLAMRGREEPTDDPLWQATMNQLAEQLYGARVLENL